MTKAAAQKILKVLDDTNLTREEKLQRILRIAASQHQIDKALFKGVLRELGYNPKEFGID